MQAREATPPPKTDSRLEVIRDEYLNAQVPWIVGFSGGKDSSALLRLLFASLSKLKSVGQPVTIVYCDTGVEIPVVSSLVTETLKGVEREAQRIDLPIHVKVATPRLEDRFFVKVIGRGYPPPTNKFRWCTDRLRINPVQRVIRSLATEQHGESVVLLGVRQGESPERDRTLSRVGTEKPFYLRQVGHQSTSIFAPVLDYSATEIWQTVMFMTSPEALDGRRLWNLYGDAAAEECPLIRDPTGSPCGKGRFGCWTCTVIRKDHSTRGLVEAGYEFLQPLVEYRDWLQAMRDEPENRCHLRRNGTPGPGPLTLKARKMALERLKETEDLSELSLLGPEELSFIQELWRQDEHSETYQNIEG